MLDKFLATVHHLSGLGLYAWEPFVMILKIQQLELLE